MLFNYRAKVDLLNMWKYTPLNYTVLARHLSVLKLFVERGADVRLKNKDGETARVVAWSELWQSGWNL
jgi:ankyrin repeat protein